MRGYHFTSLANWQTIARQGLKPYLIDSPGIRSIFWRDVYGIWVWPEEHDAESELGTVLFQVSTKNTLDVVQLWVDYIDADVLQPPHSNTMQLWHNGAVGAWRYHQGKAAIILTEEIPPECVGLVRAYHLLDLVRPAATAEAPTEPLRLVGAGI